MNYLTMTVLLASLITAFNLIGSDTDYKLMGNVFASVGEYSKMDRNRLVELLNVAHKGCKWRPKCLCKTTLKQSTSKLSSNKQKNCGPRITYRKNGPKLELVDDTKYSKLKDRIIFPKLYKKRRQQDYEHHEFVLESLNREILAKKYVSSYHCFSTVQHCKHTTHSTCKIPDRCSTASPIPWTTSPCYVTTTLVCATTDPCILTMRHSHCPEIETCELDPFPCMPTTSTCFPTTYLTCTITPYVGSTLKCPTTTTYSHTTTFCYLKVKSTSRCPRRAQDISFPARRKRSCDICGSKDCLEHVGFRKFANCDAQTCEPTLDCEMSTTTTRRLTTEREIVITTRSTVTCTISATPLIREYSANNNRANDASNRADNYQANDANNRADNYQANDDNSRANNYQANAANNRANNYQANDAINSANNNYANVASNNRVNDASPVLDVMTMNNSTPFSTSCTYYFEVSETSSQRINFRQYNPATFTVDLLSTVFSIRDDSNFKNTDSFSSITTMRADESDMTDSSSFISTDSTISSPTERIFENFNIINP